MEGAKCYDNLLLYIILINILCNRRNVICFKQWNFTITLVLQHVDKNVSDLSQCTTTFDMRHLMSPFVYKIGINLQTSQTGIIFKSLQFYELRLLITCLGNNRKYNVLISKRLVKD